MQTFTEKDRELAREIEAGKNTLVQKLAGDKQAKGVNPKVANSTEPEPIGTWKQDNGETYYWKHESNEPTPEPIGTWKKDEPGENHQWKPEEKKTEEVTQEPIGTWT